MKKLLIRTLIRAMTLAAIAAALAPAQPRRPPPRPVTPGLPDGAGRDTTQRVCGSTCHGPEIVAGKGYTRNNWAAVVNGMIARGAKATDAEISEIVDYLGKSLPPKTGTAGAGGVGFIGAGPDDAHVVDAEAAERGKNVYAMECITCHGNKARGGPESLPKAQQGSDLVRSMVLIKDRYGARIGDFLKNGHPMQSGKSSASMAGKDVIDLSHFLHLKLTETLRSGPYSQPINVLTGNAKAGEAYFSGAGGCNKCHSVTGDLAKVGAKYDPVTLQQKFLFPTTFGVTRNGARTTRKPVTAKITTPDGKTVSGVLQFMDDFYVALKDESGEYRSWKRGPGLKIEENDPYAMHVALLDKYTDKNIHDIVAYLEGLK